MKIRIILYLYCTFSFAYISYCQVPDLVNFNGRAKFLTEISYRETNQITTIIKEDTGKQYKNDSSVSIFDNKGFRIKRTLYSFDLKTGLPDEIHVYKYFNGNETSNVRYGSNGKMEETDITIYNSNGKAKKETGKYADGTLAFKEVYNYDNNGKLISIENNDGENNFTKTVLIYDKHGNKIEEDTYSPINKIQDKQNYTYDNLGNLVKQDMYNTAKIGEGSITYIYDNNRNIIEEDFYNPNGSLLSNHLFSYKFDNHNNWIEMLEKDINTSLKDFTNFKYTKRIIVY